MESTKTSTIPSSRIPTPSLSAQQQTIKSSIMNDLPQSYNTSQKESAISFQQSIEELENMLNIHNKQLQELMVMMQEMQHNKCFDNDDIKFITQKYQEQERKFTEQANKCKAILNASTELNIIIRGRREFFARYENCMKCNPEMTYFYVKKQIEIEGMLQKKVHSIETELHNLCMEFKNE